MPARAWELLLGALLAVYRPSLEDRPALAAFASLLGLAMILGSVVLLDAESLFPGLAALPACLGAAMIILCGKQNHRWVYRLLTNRGMVFVGLISYSLYLWHWPVFSFAHYYLDRPTGIAEAALLIAFSLSAATLSWRFVEQPFRGRAAVVSNPLPTLRWGGLAIATVVFLGWALNTTDGAASRVPSEVNHVAEYAASRNPLALRCHFNQRQRDVDPGNCSFGSAAGQSPDFIVIGDSHADHWIPGLRKAAESAGLVGVQLTATSCVPLIGVSQVTRGQTFDVCQDYAALVWPYLNQLPTGRVIVLAARWSSLYATDEFMAPDKPRWYVTDDISASLSVENTQRAMRTGLERTVAQLVDWGHQVVVLGQVPEFGRDPLNCTLRAMMWGNPCRPCIPPAEEVMTRLEPSSVMMGEVLDGGLRGTRLLEPHRELCGSADCTLFIDGVYLYRDDDHLNLRGSAAVVTELGLLGRIMDPGSEPANLTTVPSSETLSR